MEHVDIVEFEVISLDGRDLVTIIINGKAFNTSSAVAKVLAGDIAKAAKRAKLAKTSTPGYRRCNGCDGMGKVKYRKCALCNGTGAQFS